MTRRYIAAGVGALVVVLLFYRVILKPKSAQVSEVTPVNLSNSTGVQTIDVNLQVMGGFFRLESFLTRLEDLGRVLEVSSMAVAPQTDPETGLMTLASTITFKMYVVQADAHVTGKAAVVPPSKATPSATPTPTPATTPTPTPTSS